MKIIALQPTNKVHGNVHFVLRDFLLYNKHKHTWMLRNTIFISCVEHISLAALTCYIIIPDKLLS